MQSILDGSVLLSIVVLQFVLQIITLVFGIRLEKMCLEIRTDKLFLLWQKPCKIYKYVLNQDLVLKR
jgi:hypothetical protein